MAHGDHGLPGTQAARLDPAMDGEVEPAAHWPVPPDLVKPYPTRGEIRVELQRKKKKQLLAVCRTGVIDVTTHFEELQVKNLCSFAVLDGVIDQKEDRDEEEEGQAVGLTRRVCDAQRQQRWFGRVGWMPH